MFDRVLRAIEWAFQQIAALLLVVMMLVVSASALGRYFLGSPIMGAVEVTQLFLMVGVVWLAMSDTERVGGHVGIGFIVEHAPRLAQLWARVLTRLASAVIIGLVCWGSVEKTLSVAGATTAGVIRLPVGPSWALVALGAAALALRLLLETFQALHDVIYARSSPASGEEVSATRSAVPRRNQGA